MYQRMRLAAVVERIRAMWRLRGIGREFDGRPATSNETAALLESSKDVQAMLMWAGNAQSSPRPQPWKFTFDSQDEQGS